MTYVCLDCLAESVIAEPAPPYSPLLCPRHREFRAPERLMWTGKRQGDTVEALLEFAGKSEESEPGDHTLRTELLIVGALGLPLSKREAGRVDDAIRWARDAK